MLTKWEKAFKGTRRIMRDAPAAGEAPLHPEADSPYRNYNLRMASLHFDCFSGISGDMTLAALVDLGVDEQQIRNGLASLQLPIEVAFEPVKRCGIRALYARVEVGEEPRHRFLKDIEEILSRGQLRERVRDLALTMFRRIAEAEAKVHGMPIERVHFHEVGALDSIADIVGVAIGFDSLGVSRVTAKPVPLGHGMVSTEHGQMPVPAPATVELLRGVPTAPTDVQAELTTPTGAAILATLVDDWLPQPGLKATAIGYGAGRRDLIDRPNVLRLLLGQPVEPATGDASTETLWVIETNLDDLTPEVIGYCCDRLFAAGAVDVYTQPIFMKKNRPGVLLTALVPDAARDAVEQVMFRETTTLGIRRYRVERPALERRAVEVQTPWGPVRAKRALLPDGTDRLAPEYEDCARIARDNNIPLIHVYETVRSEAARRPVNE